MEIAQGLWFIFRVALLCLMCGAAATLGIAAVCRWLKWSPVNITVNVNGIEYDTEFVSEEGKG